VIIATFNVENLFERPRAMNFPTWTAGQPALDAAGELNALINKRVYADADKRRMLHLLKKQQLLATRPNNPLLELRKVRGQLFELSPKPRIVASGRESWAGWVELKTEPLADDAITNTARVIAEVNPDILVLVEVESRPAVQHFHDKVLLPLLKHPYPYNMVIDGNDERGIDVGILSRYPIQRMRSHIADSKGKSRIFSRDCPEYYIELPSGRELLLLPNHFASKGSDATGKRRRLQAAAVRTIYESLRKRYPYAIVAGDFNDDPESNALEALLRKTNLRDAMSLKQYQGAFPGTYQRATAKEKIDYLLLSPALRSKVQAVDVCRKGFYAPRKWESFENINEANKERFQASDHHCLWAEIQL
jgi:endonuclease/exonuclease/phosphatase family metal-dependent hydrolase